MSEFLSLIIDEYAMLVKSEKAYQEYRERLQFEIGKMKMIIWNNNLIIQHDGSESFHYGFYASLSCNGFLNNEQQSFSLDHIRFSMAYDKSTNNVVLGTRQQYSPVMHFPLSEEQHFQYSLLDEHLPSFEDTMILHDYGMRVINAHPAPKASFAVHYAPNMVLDEHDITVIMNDFIPRLHQHFGVPHV